MPINVNAIVEAVKRAGPTKVRVTPMAGQAVDGQQQIEVYEEGQWRAIAEGLAPATARQLINESQNRVILG